MGAPRMVVADIPGKGRMWYLVDDSFDFIPEAKEFLDWKAATKRSPGTLEAYCWRLGWFFRFLWQRQVDVCKASPADLVDFVIWLCNPLRDAANVTAIHQPSPLRETTVNQILQAVGALYRFLVRRGRVKESPVQYEDVPRGRWLTERDLLAHTRKGKDAHTVKRMELKLKEPKKELKTVSEGDFRAFVESIHAGRRPGDDPAGFRDRLMCLLLKEGGFRIGELLGMRLEDLDYAHGGLFVRFRADNENDARAKAGYGCDRFVHLPQDVMGLLDLYITEVWVEAAAETDHLWLVLKKEARDRDGRTTYGRALRIPAVQKMFEHYSHKSGIRIHPHMLRHTHATELVRSYLQDGRTVDWKFIQERLGHASVVTTMQTYAHLTDDDRRTAYETYLKRKEQQRASRQGSSPEHSRE